MIVHSKNRSYMIIIMFLYKLIYFCIFLYILYEIYICLRKKFVKNNKKLLQKVW